MANLNLSQFGENSSVSDADYTFVWDSANAISKKVSRNSWLNSGTLTSSAPVTISQTWNGTVSTVFTALKVNAVSTVSSTSSYLLDLQVGGVSQFSVQRNGTLRMTSTDAETKLSYSAAGFLFFGSGAPSLFIGQDGTGNGNAVMGNTGFIGFSSAFTAASGNADTRLYRDGAANTLALRNGAAAQTFRVYNTYSDGGVNYERVAFAWAGNTAFLDVGASGSGTRRDLNIGAQNVSLLSGSGPTLRWQINSLGHFIAGTDNAYDIGASGANRPRNIYVGGSVYAASGFGGDVFNYFYSGSTSAEIRIGGGLAISWGGGSGAAALMRFGGTTDAFPAIARDGAGIKFTGAAAGSTSWIKVPPVAVSALPLAAPAGAGARAFVNDASAPVFGSAVTGGGAVLVPVYSDGSAWNVG